MIAVGDITLEELQPRLEEVLAGWTPGSEIPGNVRPATQVAERRIFLVDQPGAAQTQIRVGRIGAPRITDDYYALQVLNTVLGGSFSSRLNTNLREIHGYGYGAGSEFDCRLLPGPFIAWSAVESGVTDSALIEIFHELERIGQPVPEEELERAKHYLALGYPASFQTVSSVAYQLDEMATYGLPEDYFNRFIDNILSVSADDVQSAAQRYIDPTTMLVVLVGDRSMIEQRVRALALGPVEILDADDLLGPSSCLANHPRIHGRSRQRTTPAMRITPALLVEFARRSRGDPLHWMFDQVEGRKRLRKHVSLLGLNRDVVRCRLCPRLVRWRERVAREKVRRFAGEIYWGKPITGFGDPEAELLLVGLAPAAHGANRTGRIFTGDESGRWLFRALHRAGFANQTGIHLQETTDLCSRAATSLPPCGALPRQTSRWLWNFAVADPTCWKNFACSRGCG